MPDALTLMKKRYYRISALWKRFMPALQFDFLDAMPDQRCRCRLRLDEENAPLQRKAQIIQQHYRGVIR